MPTIKLLMTGDELLIGDIIDTNSSYIAKSLFDIGIKVSEKVTIGDHQSILVEKISQLSQSADVLIINGGLGPTEDDLTSLALANCMQEQLAEHTKAIAHLKSWAEKKRMALTPSNLKQAQLPESADIIANAIGSAVGIYVKLNDCHVFCTPGVPSELKVMIEDEIKPKLAELFSSHKKVHVKKYLTFGIGESTAQEMLLPLTKTLPDSISLGYRAAMPLLELKLLSPQKHESLNKISQQIETLFDDHIIAKDYKDATSISDVVVNLLREKQVKIACVESCTGGLIASMITSVSGSSEIFESGYVTYSNQAKTDMVGVKEETLIAHGAVSEQVVKEMVTGALERSDADVAVAVSGIAGPNGGTKEKPVGTVCVAWGDNDEIQSTTFIISGNRQYFQTMVAARALDLIRRKIANSEYSPAYMKSR